MHGSASRGAQLLVEDDAHALATFGVPDRALGDAVAVLFEKEGLQADLDALGFVGALGDVRALAAFVVDRRDRAILGFGDVDLGDDAEGGGGEVQRAGRDGEFGRGDGLR